jgi:hypothetical protein
MKMKTTWIRGERTPTGLKGKNGGPVMTQVVTKVIGPRS